MNGQIVLAMNVVEPDDRNDQRYAPRKVVSVRTMRPPELIAPAKTQTAVQLMLFRHDFGCGVCGVSDIAVYLPYVPHAD